MMILHSSNTYVSRGLMRSRVTVILICLALASCGRKDGGPEQRYELKGKVVSVDRLRREATIAHEAIPGYMSAMTMPFKLKDEWPLRALQSGDRVQAVLVVAANRSWLEAIVVTKENAELAAGAAKPALEPALGVAVPDFALVNQNGNAIHLQQYRGSVLLITFIYTRCPLPDYCPRMSSQFAQIQKEIRQHSEIYPPTRLLSISFDADYDQPDVLRSYARAFLDSKENHSAAIWEFASGSREQVSAICRFFGLSYSEEEGQIVHSLRTALITADGRLSKIYRGNDWTPALVLRDLSGLNPYPSR